ncbi:hypothetical protein B0H34DRAFT_800984 [Crassisporium funariophilum]|nr:hypothetical protein B0H34DRAFT_800984 [Crassisporium funariophilum]
MAAPTQSAVCTSLPAALFSLTIHANVISAKSYHPLFSSPDADVVLRSNEGTLYRVHSYTLRATSGLFNTMFSLPQPQSCRPQGQHAEMRETFPDILDVYEGDLAMEPLLKLLCGLPIPKWKSLDNLGRILALAEKWDTPGPLASMRSALSSQQFMAHYPLRCYSLARHFGWDHEAKLASSHTLSLDLYDPIHANALDHMSSKDLLPLLNLHRKRRDLFRELLNSPERFAAGNSSPYHCNRCGVTELDSHTWRELKTAMFSEMERRPLGDTLGLVMGDTAEWPEAKACWEAKCTKEECGGLNYDRVATLRQIRGCIELLPSTIEV